MILAVDTSTDEAGVAIMDGDSLLAEINWRAGGNHSRRLTPTIKQAIELAGVALTDVHAVAVAIGPGSFSGIRVGLSAAKGLAFGLGVPLVGISTLDVLAAPGQSAGDPVWALIPAGRGQLYAARYAELVGGWQRTTEYQLLTPAEAAAEVAEGDNLAGPGAAEVLGALGNRARLVRLPAPAGRLRRAGYLAELGRHYLEAGGEDQLHTVQPLYLRRSAAEENRVGRPQE
jgi:tRNA threonylcarbamoyladenosine biosynthesis protein TsaB